MTTNGASSLRHADPRNCPVVVGVDDDAAHSILVCDEPLPCADHGPCESCGSWLDLISHEIMCRDVQRDT